MPDDTIRNRKSEIKDKRSCGTSQDRMNYVCKNSVSQTIEDDKLNKVELLSTLKRMEESQDTKFNKKY